jgi:peptidoglycan hydrolase-like protein with peptidoglycan-binding domain
MRYDLQDDELTFSSAIRGTVAFVGETIASNPGIAGGATAMAVAMAFFSANALYFQNQPHPSAFFETRPDVRMAEAPRKEQPSRTSEPASAGGANVTRFVLQRSEDDRAELPEALPIPAAPPQRQPTASRTAEPADKPSLAENGDRAVASIQELLSKLGYYDGGVDGLSGPMTKAAIDQYKSKAGLRGIELTSAELITSMRNNLDVTAAIPARRPDDAGQVARDMVAAMTGGDTGRPLLPGQIPSAEVVKVQAALKAFGNTDVVVDGISGGQTEAAIREFQSLFRLPVNGEIDGLLLDKMRDVGLIQ